MKTIKKVLNIAILFFIILHIILPISDAGNFNPSDFENPNEGNASQIVKITDNMLGTAIGVVQVVGTGIAITILIVIACKYMIASPGDRADIKKNAVPFVIGAVVLFGASNILAIIADFAATIS